MTVKPQHHVLLVDDDQRVLDPVYRTLRSEHDIRRARGGEQGLIVLEREGPFAVVVADYRMPRMDGEEFLGRVREHAPDTVRVMLAGREDYGTAVALLNQGWIFSFLPRPCSSKVFRAGLELALEQHELIRAKGILIGQTLRRHIQVLSDMLSLVNPEAFSRAVSVRGYVRHIVDRLDLSPSWPYEAAALLSQLGCISVPREVLVRLANGEELTTEEKELFDRHPHVGYRLLKKLPGLEEVAEMVVHQRGVNGLAHNQASASVSLGSQILAAVIGFDDLLMAGIEKEAAIETLRRWNICDPEVLSSLARIVSSGRQLSFRALPAAQLSVGMILDQDVVTDDGRLLITRGAEVTAGVRKRLCNYARRGSIPEPIHVRIAADAPEVTGSWSQDRSTNGA